MIEAIRKFCADIDRKHRVREDWYIIYYVIIQVLKYGYLVWKGRLNFFYTFESKVKENPDKLALVYVEGPLDKAAGMVESNFSLQKFTYKQLYDVVLRLSYVLINEYGVQPGDTVGLMTQNTPVFVFYLFALWNVGAKPAFINYNLSMGPLDHAIKVASLSQVFVDLETKESIFYDANGQESATMQLVKKSGAARINFIDKQQVARITNPHNMLSFRLPDKLRNYSDMPWDSGCYIFTSGTTGLPKAAIMSWRKINLGTRLYGRIVHINKSSTVFTAMPLYHSTASILGLLPTFQQNATLAITKKFSASNFWMHAKLVNATHIQYVGEICRYLLNRPVNAQLERGHNVRVAYGNGLRKDIWMDFKQRFNIEAIGEFFASTEAPIATTSFQKGDFGVGACRNYGTVINYILSFQQRLVKMDDANEDVERDPVTGLCKEPRVGEPGQLLFRISRPNKPYVDFQGYINDEKETKNKIIYNVYKKGDCWMKTGDLLKQDEHGLYYFIDRLGDTFRWKSENVSTNEVEMEINRFPLVAQSVVVGVKIPQCEGRAGYATLKLTESSQMDIDQFLVQFSQHVTRCLPKYAVPVFIKIVSDFKTTDTHKVIKKYYQNQKMPFGDGAGDVYWFNKAKYEPLSEKIWQDIANGRINI